MQRAKENPRERPNASRVWEGIREEEKRDSACLTPDQRMQMAFVISRDALRLCRAGLEAQGFSESEIDAIIDEQRR